MHPQTTKTAIDEFLSHETFALVGASRSGKKFGNTVAAELTRAGYRVVLVHPEADSIDGAPCVRHIADLPGGIGGLVVSIPAVGAEAVVREAANAAITRVWLLPGATSVAAVRAAEERGVSIISDECIIMYLRSCSGIHKLHRGVRSLFGTLPK